MEQKIEENTKQKNLDFFKWLLEKEDVILNKQVDLTLCHFMADPNIYIPEEIQKFIDTKAMQRTSRILQLSNIISVHPNTYHTRLEHGIGVYDKKKQIIMNLYQDENWKKNIEDKNLKPFLIAEMIKSLAHDIGHLPLSHVLEINVIGKRDFHEEIGKRILLEDSQIQNVLVSICPTLPESLAKVLDTDMFGFSLLDEGNYDIDRFDYLIRDSLHKGQFIDMQFEHFYQTEIPINSLGNPIICDDR